MATAKHKYKVLVLFDTAGTPPADQDFTKELKTDDWAAEAHVITALRKLGHEVRTIGVWDEPGMIIDEIKTNPPDVVFNLTEHFKELLAYHKIRVPNFAMFSPGSTIKRPKRLKFPLFIKPVKEEGSVGISLDSFVDNDTAFEERIRFIHERLNQEALAEEFIEGRELYVSILGTDRLRVFPYREVIFAEVPEGQPKFSTFKAKWDDAYRKRWGIQNVFAEALPNGTSQRIAKICRAVYRALRIRGYGRIDLRVTPEGEIVILEANPNPNLDRKDEFAQSAMKVGLSYTRMIQRILTLALTAPH